MRKIIREEDLKVYDSIADATEDLTGSRYKSNIREALSNSARENRAYNYTYHYIDSEMGRLLLEILREEQAKEVM